MGEAGEGSAEEGGVQVRGEMEEGPPATGQKHRLAMRRMGRGNRGERKTNKCRPSWEA